jgi:PAS domain S-box-containing protein
MDYRLEDLLDIPLMQTLQDKLNEIYSFPSAIVDNEGKILTAVAWQDICTKFHRTNPLSEKECIKSDLYILEHLHEANPAVCYLCPHGLIDNAMPIVIAGKHLGIFFTGQFFLEKPDLAYFKNQAKVYGFDEQAYLEAVKSVPIWSQMKLSQYLDFIKVFIDIITGIGLNQLNALEAGKAIKESLEKTNIILDTAITESKRAAEALRESEQRWQFALEGAGNGVWDWNARTNEVFFSRKWKEMLGYKEDEIGNTLDEWSNRIHPDDVPHCFDDLNRHFRKETTHYQNEHRVLCKDGSYKWIADCGKVVEWDANGKPLRVISTHSDITERKKAEQALFQSEEKFSKAFLTAPYAIIITTVENTKVIGIEII